MVQSTHFVNDKKLSMMERFYPATVHAPSPNFAFNDRTSLVQLLNTVGFADVTVEKLVDIRNAEATAIGCTARYALVAYHPV